MFENLSRDPPDKSVPLAEAQLIPALWETPRSAFDATCPPISWKFPTELYPLIRPAGSLEALQLSARKPNPVQLLLEEGLKLTAYAGGIAVPIREALALICWLGLVTQRSPKAETALSS